MSGREATTAACDAQSPSALLWLMLDCRRPALTLASVFLDAGQKTCGLAPNLTFLPAKKFGKAGKFVKIGFPDLGSALEQRHGEVNLRAGVAVGVIRRIQLAVVRCQKAREIETGFDCYLADR